MNSEKGPYSLSVTFSDGRSIELLNFERDEVLRLAKLIKEKLRGIQVKIYENKN